jgi:transcription elongation GreA/GreB family factor
LPLFAQAPGGSLFQGADGTSDSAQVRCASLQSGELQVDDFVEDLDESDVRAARIGSRVRLKDESGVEDRFTIKWQEEERLEQGRMSLAPALVRALLGRWAGEEVHVWTPAGARMVTIVEVD